MPEGGTETVPRIVVSDPPPTQAERIIAELARLNPAGALFAMVANSGETARSGVRSLLRSLIEEGRRYAGTPAGRQWSALLEASPAVTSGWMLWNHANVDLYLRNAEPLADSPAALFEAALRELGQANAATWLAQLSRLGAELDAAAVTSDGGPQA